MTRAKKKQNSLFHKQYKRKDHAELKNDEFSDLYVEGNELRDNSKWLSECIVESDMELLFPNEYIPSSAERISLYKELDSIDKEADIEKFILKIKDRFGTIPHESMELIRIVNLRIMAKSLGIEKVMLKNDKLYLYFLSGNNEQYFQSEEFGALLSYLQNHPKETQIKENKNKRYLLREKVYTVEKALNILNEVKEYTNHLK